MNKILALTGFFLLALMMMSCDGGGDTKSYFPTTDYSLWNYEDKTLLLSGTTGITTLVFEEIPTTLQSGDFSYRLNGTNTHNTQVYCRLLRSI